MAYGKDFAKSARRHLCAADELVALQSGGSQPGCRAVAGYLFGLSGELALKEIMRDSGMSPLAPSSRKDDPFWAHFPRLKSLLVDQAKGRRSDELKKIAEEPSLFQHWDIDMRYAPTKDIKDRWVMTWQRSARELVGKI